MGHRGETSVDRSFHVSRKSKGAIASPVHDPRALAGLLQHPHHLSIYKGPVLAAISADEFRPRLICLSLFPRCISLFGEPRATRVASYRSKGRVRPRFRRSARRKDAPKRQGTLRAGRAEPANTRGTGSGDAADGQVTRATHGPKPSAVAASAISLRRADQPIVPASIAFVHSPQLSREWCPHRRNVQEPCRSPEELGRRNGCHLHFEAGERDP